MFFKFIFIFNFKNLLIFKVSFIFISLQFVENLYMNPCKCFLQIEAFTE